MKTARGGEHHSNATLDSPFAEVFAARKRNKSDADRASFRPHTHGMSAEKCQGSNVAVADLIAADQFEDGLLQRIGTVRNLHFVQRRRVEKAFKVSIEAEHRRSIGSLV